MVSADCSSTEAVEGAALSLKSVDDVESGDGLSLGVLGVGNGVTDNVLEEGSEDVSGLFVDQRGDSLDTTTTSESADSRLGDSKDGLLQGFLSVSLGADLSVALANFASSSHCYLNLIILSFKLMPYIVIISIIIV
jgi:hypothetical protein